MKLSTRSTYGMRALVELALAAGRGPVSAALIARRQTLSVAYLEQLLHRLKRQGLITSTRGPRGGYVLAREPHHITMAEVVRVLDGGSGEWRVVSAREAARAGAPNGRGRLATIRTLVGEPARQPRHAPARETSQHAQRIGTAIWRCVHERLVHALGDVTLRDLCEEVQREGGGEPLDHRYVFHI